MTLSAPTVSSRVRRSNWWLWNGATDGFDRRSHPAGGEYDVILIDCPPSSGAC